MRRRRETARARRTGCRSSQRVTSERGTIRRIMRIIAGALFLIQFCFAFHVFKTGRPYWWMFIIMKTWHKMTLRTLGALVVLLLLAAVASRVLVNPEKLKALAREKAQSAWSRDLTIGQLEFGFLPAPWLQADDVSFANPPWAGERHFFHADRITAHLALLPLIGGNVKLRSLFVEGGKAVLEVSKDGRGNWELGARKPQEAAPVAAAARDFQHGRATEVTEPDRGAVGRQ